MRYKTETHRYKQGHGSYQREGKGVIKGKGAKYVVTGDDFTLGGGHMSNIQIVYHGNVHMKPI